MNASIQVKILKEFPAAFLREARSLYIGNHWIEADENPAFPENAFRGSTAVAAAFCNERTAGFARVISDGVSDAYIQDVLVAPEFRRQGIGRKLVAALIGELRSRGIDWIGIVGVPGSEEFYRSCGAVPQPGHTLYLAGEA